MQTGWLKHAVVAGTLLAGLAPSGPAGAVPSGTTPSDSQLHSTPPPTEAAPRKKPAPGAKAPDALDALPVAGAFSTIDPLKSPFTPGIQAGPAGQPNLITDKTVKTVDGWSIGLSKSMGGCLAAATYEDHTTLWFGFSRKDDEGFLALTNPDWTLLKARKRYDLTLATEELGAWRGTFTAIVRGSEKGLLVRKLHTRFVLDLTRAKVLEAQTPSKAIAKLSLAGVKPAMDALVDCQIAYLEGRDPSASGRKAQSGDLTSPK